MCIRDRFSGVLTAFQRSAQLERHTGTAQILEGACVVLPLGVHNGNGFGQLLGGQVVVGNCLLYTSVQGKVADDKSRIAKFHRAAVQLALIIGKNAQPGAFGCQLGDNGGVVPILYPCLLYTSGVRPAGSSW